MVNEDCHATGGLHWGYAHESVGAAVEAFCNARVKRYLPHEDEQRDDSESIRREGVEKILHYHCHSAFQRNQYHVAHKTDQSHCEGHLDPCEKKNEQDTDGENADYFHFFFFFAGNLRCPRKRRALSGVIPSA
jgi:hypothetical protein